MRGINVTEATEFDTVDSMAIFGRDDMVDIVLLDDYQEALERTARLWGGDPSDYRSMTVREDLWSMTLPRIRAKVLASALEPLIAMQKQFNDSLSLAAAQVAEFLENPDTGVTLKRPVRVMGDALSGEVTDEIMRDPELRRDIMESDGEPVGSTDPWERRHAILIPHMEARLNAAVRLLDKAEKALDTEGWEATGKAHAYWELASMHHKMATF